MPAPAYHPSRAEEAREERLLNDPVWQGERGALVHLLHDLHAAQDDGAYLELQLTLLERLKARQDTITRLRRDRAELKAEHQALAGRSPKPVDELRALQARVADNDHQEYVRLALHRLTRDLGDALAWRRLGYNRAAITAVGQGAPVGWLSDGCGFAGEMRAVQELWQQGVFALVNDATNCLRLGDITCFFPDRVELREVKAGRVASSGSTQMKRLAAVAELVNAGRGEFDGHRRALVRAIRPYRTHLAQLPALVERASRDGLATRRVSPSQLVVAKTLFESHQFTTEDARRAAAWDDQDVVLDWGTTMRRLRDRHYDFAYLAPPPLLPLAPEPLADLLLGVLDVTAWVNVSAVARDLVARGYAAADPAAPPDSRTRFLTVARVRGTTLTTLQVAPHLREMMAIELMTPASLADMIAALLDHSDRTRTVEGEQPAVVPGPEHEVWERRARS